ncbi:MAG: nucleotidyltransferase family protein [Cytophagales bacterium]|nr:nucleotidyltransferase family protein [Cytophagales bacterium]
MRLTNAEVMQYLDALLTKTSEWIGHFKSSPQAGGCHEVTGGAAAGGANEIILLILASGRGERFTASGGATHKLDAPFAGKTVLQATLAKARASGLACHVERADHAGMGDTIAAAVAANRHADGWLILPADMPLISPEVICAVANVLKNSAEHAAIAMPVVQGQRGHPVGFSRACLDDLLALSGDMGARALLNKFAVKKIAVDHLPNARGCLIDIDTVADLAAASFILAE